MAKKIKVNIFEDMKAALKGAAAYERGEPVNLRVTSDAFTAEADFSQRGAAHSGSAERQPVAFRQLPEREP